ncbi:hypothetical protein P3S67_019234 [Capsicum chacoense]
MGLFTKLFGESFSHKFCCPPLLQNLDLSENSISCLPAWVKSLPQLRNLSVQSCKMLKSLTGIPSCITELSIQGCSSLERMTYHSILHKCKLVVDDEWGSLVLIEGGFKLEDLENAGAQILGRFGLDVERMENVVFKMEHFLGSEDKMLPLQGLYEHGVFSTFLPGNRILSWFISGKDTDAISFIISASSLNNNVVRGLSIAVVHTCSEHQKHSRAYWCT